MLKNGTSIYADQPLIRNNARRRIQRAVIKDTYIFVTLILFSLMLSLIELLQNKITLEEFKSTFLLNNISPDC